MDERSGRDRTLQELARAPLCAGLGPADLARLLAAGHPLAPRNRESLFSRGDPAEAAYLLLGGDGWVEVGAANRGAKQILVEVFRAGDLFGEMGALDGSPRSADAEVHGTPRLLVLPAPAFRRALRETPGLGFNLSLLLAARLRRTFTLLRDAAFESLEVRLARQLLYLAAQGTVRGPAGLRLARRLNQQQMADLLGATSRSIITILNGWRERGIVAYDGVKGWLTLTDEAALRGLIATGEEG